MELLRYISLRTIAAIALLFSAFQAEASVPLPKVPRELTRPADRAAYIIRHFWDAATFPDVASDPELEQAFVNFVSVFPLADADSARTAAVDTLVARSVRSSCAGAFSDLAEKYLYKLDSPMVDEETYLLFLDSFIARPDYPAAEKRLKEYQRSTVLNNRVGTQAGTFRYRNRDNRLCSFVPESMGKDVVLVFYDTECSHCREVIAQLEKSGPDCRYVAIAVNAGKAAFMKSLDFIPDSWEAGYDATGLVNGTIYAIRSLPDVFLISSEGIVKAKHVDVGKLIAAEQ